MSRDRIRPEEAATEKEAWVSHVLRDWGSCGRVVLVDDRPVGYAIYAPDAFLPGAGAFPTAPVSPDAVLLTNVWVHPRHVGGGLGRMLVQGMARDLIKRGGIRAVEAFGDTRGPGRRGSCVVPSDFLGSVGFKTQRAARRHAADADGAARGALPQGRGRGGARAAGGRRTPGQGAPGRGPDDARRAELTRK